MGRLIDEDDVISLLAYHHFDDDRENFDLLIHNLCKEVRCIPTAYAPGKVVEQLEDYGNEETHYYKNTPYEKCIEECIGKAIQIVKGGGVDG